MNRLRTRTVTLLLIAASGWLAGCEGPNLEPRALPAQTSAETFENFGDYELHFNALKTDQLTPEVARTYGIQRSTNRVLLNVTILKKQPENGSPTPVEGIVSVDAYNLSGQLKNIGIRRVTEGTAVYYIGEVSIAGNEILVFDIRATPVGESEAFTVRFRREFFAG